MHLEIKYLPLVDLRPYKGNSRTHSEAQIAQIAASIKEFGFVDPILTRNNEIIAGHGRLQAAALLELSEIPTIDLSHLSKNQAKALVIAHNKIAENAGWDLDALRSEVEDLQLAEFDLDILGFEDLDLVLSGSDESPKDEPYSREIKAPIYEPSEEKPKLIELVGYEKTNELIKEIEASDLSKSEKDFLKHSAERHAVFDFSKIADYYSHASPKMQHLMERSGLVIIDFDKAIANGFVKLTESIVKQYGQDFGSDDD